MSKGFTYDVLVRSVSGNPGQFFAGQLQKRSLKAIHFAWTPGPSKRDARFLEDALEKSRVMILVLDSLMTDDYWWVLEGESSLFDSVKHPEKKLIVIRMNGAPLKPGLEKYPSFEWGSATKEKEFEPIYLACLPEKTGTETPAAIADDCPLKRRFSFGHAAEVTTIAISSDSTRGISASLDHTLRLWHLPTGRCERVLENGPGKYRAVALHPTEPLAVSGDSEGSLICWDLETGEPQYTLEGHSGAVNSVCWSPNGTRILSGSADGTLRIWQDRICRWKLAGHTKSVTSVSWSTRGQILSASTDQTVRFWNAEKAEQLQEWNMSDIQDVSFSPDGDAFFIQNKHSGLRIWRSGEALPPVTDKAGKTIRVVAAQWGRDSKSILLCTDSVGAIMALDLTSGKLEEIFTQAWGFRGRCLAWSPDGKYCMLGRTDGAIQFWSPKQGEKPVAKQNAAQDTKQNAAQERPTFVMTELGHHGALCRTALASNGRFLASGGADETARRWDFETGALLSTLDKGHKGEVGGLAWSPDNRFLVSASVKNKDLRLSGLKLDDSPLLLYGQGQPAQISWGPDTQLNTGTSLVNPRDYILATSSDQTVRLWHRTKQEPVKEFRGHSAATTAIKWSPDGRYALSGSLDNTIILWDVFAGRQISKWHGHNGAITDISWSLDGKQAVAASIDRTLRIWEVSTGHCLQILEGHTAVVTTVAWSPDGRFLASGAEDKTVRIWDAHNGDCLNELSGPTEKIVTVTWTNDSQTLLASAANGVMHVWDVSILQTRPGKSAARSGFAIAKVMICGNSGVGKTALAIRFAQNKFEPTISTDGIWATQCAISSPSSNAQRQVLPSAATEKQISPSVTRQTSQPSVTRQTSQSSGTRQTSQSPGEPERQIWLWDFAGQSDYRLVHQLFMQDAEVVLLLFDPQDKNPFEKLDSWVQDLQKLRNASNKPFKMLLAAGRIDCGSLWVSRDAILQWMEKNGIQGPLYLTSARTGEGCETLRDGIVAAIEWPAIPLVVSPDGYTRLRQEIITLRDTGQLFISLSDLNSRLKDTLKGTSFTPEELDTVITSLTRTGVIRRMDFDDLIMLKPEVLSRYAGAVIRKVHNQPNEMGYIDEQDLLEGNVDYQSLERLPAEQERAVFATLYGLFTKQPWVLQQTTENGRTLLVFPTYFRRERLTQKAQPEIAWTYHFRGPADEIYASLVTHLSHTESFVIEELWHNAVDLKTREGQQLGLRLVDSPGGDHKLDIWFQATPQGNSLPGNNSPSNTVPGNSQSINNPSANTVPGNSPSINNPPSSTAPGSTPSISTPPSNTPPSTTLPSNTAPGSTPSTTTPPGTPAPADETTRRLFLQYIYIQLCRWARDVSQPPKDKKAGWAEIERQILDIEKNSVIVLNNLDKEGQLIAWVSLLCSSVGQIFRATSYRDVGIDGHIEFTDIDGTPSAKVIYLQLKAGNSYLRHRETDDKEIFQIQKRWHVEYWKKHDDPVLLVIRTARHGTLWMDVREYIVNAEADGTRITQIVFDGEPFDPESILKWRDRIISKGRDKITSPG